jgi:hypothetical protein
MPRLVLAAIATLSLTTMLTAADGVVRVATFNVQELSWKKLQDVDADGKGNNAQLLAAAAIIRQVRPDVLLLNEIDYTGPVDADGETDRNAARLFVERYLKGDNANDKGLDYPHLFYRATNTGMPSGIDLNNNGKSDDPNDAYGFGRYPGEYGMALLSKFPIDDKHARTFRKLLWKDMPGHIIPDGKDSRPAFYTEDQLKVFRLSSKSHWDVPITIHGKSVHLLCSHPTPPVFDGSEDAHGRRNHDELRFWCDYLNGGDAGKWIRDDSGATTPFATNADFIVMGDLNADMYRGDTVNGVRAIRCLLENPRVHDPMPHSAGGKADGRPGDKFGDAAKYKTSHFSRLDYVLPSKTLPLSTAGVFWPAKGEPLAEEAETASDHRLVWIDLRMSP